MGKKQHITKTITKNATDSRSWQRGVNYYNEGRVQSLLIDGNEITAKVSGTYNYRVSLDIQDGNIKGDCSCPMGDGGYFCKHCVAVGLAFLDGKGLSVSSKKKNTAKVTMEDIHRYLASKSKPELLDMLMDQVKKNDAFREKLFLHLAANRKGKIAIDTFRQAIEKATSGYDYDYLRQGYYDDDNSCDIYDVVDSIEGLLKDGYAEEVMELAEYAIDRCDGAMEQRGDCDDLYSNVERLMDLYYTACQQAKPDPEVFAEKLFKLSLENSWFRRSITKFSHILGKKGMTVYRQRAFEQWEKISPLEANEKKEYSGLRSNITTIMETLAEMDDGLEMLVSVYRKSLTAPWDYLKIAKLYKEHKQRDKALEWAEKAIAVFGRKEALKSVGQFLAEEYHFRRRHDEAMKIVWDQFTEHVNLNSYQDLKKHAECCKQWEQWRLKALEGIEAEIGKGMRKAQKSRCSFSRFTDHSLLVEIFLWEKDPEKAWQEATTGGCSTSLWLKLAKERQVKYPEDSLKIYKSVIEPIVEQTNNDAYREAVKYIKAIKKLMGKLGKKKEFAAYLAQIKIQFKRKRNLMKMLANI